MTIKLHHNHPPQACCMCGQPAGYVQEYVFYGDVVIRYRCEDCQAAFTLGHLTGDLSSYRDIRRRRLEKV